MWLFIVVVDKRLYQEKKKRRPASPALQGFDPRGYEFHAHPPLRASVGAGGRFVAGALFTEAARVHVTLAFPALLFEAGNLRRREVCFLEEFVELDGGQVGEKRRPFPVRVFVGSRVLGEVLSGGPFGVLLLAVVLLGGDGAVPRHAQRGTDRARPSLHWKRCVLSVLDRAGVVERAGDAGEGGQAL